MRRFDENPYGVDDPIGRMAFAMIYLATGILPRQEIMDELAKRAGIPMDDQKNDAD